MKKHMDFIKKYSDQIKIIAGNEDEMQRNYVWKISRYFKENSKTIPEFQIQYDFILWFMKITVHKNTKYMFSGGREREKG